MLRTISALFLLALCWCHVCFIALVACGELYQWRTPEAVHIIPIVIFGGGIGNLILMGLMEIHRNIFEIPYSCFRFMDSVYGEVALISFGFVAPLTITFILVSMRIEEQGWKNQDHEKEL